MHEQAVSFCSGCVQLSQLWVSARLRDVLAWMLCYRMDSMSDVFHSGLSSRCRTTYYGLLCSACSCAADTGCDVPGVWLEDQGTLVSSASTMHDTIPASTIICCFIHVCVHYRLL